MTYIFLLEYVTFPAFRLNVFLNVLMVSLNILDVNICERLVQKWAIGTYLQIQPYMYC